MGWQGHDNEGDIVVMRTEVSDRDKVVEAALAESRKGQALYQRGRKLGRLIERAFKKLPSECTRDVQDALRLAIASELMKTEAHASHLQQRLDEAEKVVDGWLAVGFTDIYADEMKAAAEYRERYPK